MKAELAIKQLRSQANVLAFLMQSAPRNVEAVTREFGIANQQLTATWEAYAA